MSVGDFDERELRIAPVMTGGTSLAIWMGGATAELYRLVRSVAEERPGDAGSRIYRGLLDATRTIPVVDVITGTSAGGLNGTLLGAATALDLPLDDYLQTRTTWLELADLEALMRTSGESDPPSLLRGDDYFMVELRRVLDGWLDVHGPVTDGDLAVDMVTTVTTVVPEPRSRVDHFGESLSEIDHAQWLRFTDVDFHRPRWTEKLALAARTSASIPGVFEPSFLPIGEEHARESRRPDLELNASFRASRWAVDGGTVVNLPLGEALDRIYGKEADGDVRRVVLYVCPTPGEARSAAPDAPGRRPSIRDALMTAVTAPRAEGISADVDQLQRHNDAVERQARVRRTMASLVDVALGEIEVIVGSDSGPEPGALPGDGGTFSLYRAHRATASVEGMIDRVRQAVGPVPLDPARLTEVFSDARVELVPERVDMLSGADAPWGWGIAPVEEAVSVGLSLINRAQRLVRADTSPEAKADLTAAKEELHQARRVAAEVRALDESYWREQFGKMPGVDPNTGLLTSEEFSEPGLARWARESYAGWPVHGDPEARLGTFHALAGAHLQAANAIRGAYGAIREITTACGAVEPTGPGAVAVERTVPPGAPATRVATAFAQSLLDEATGVFGAGDDPRLVQRQLLRIHVAQTLLLGTVESREQHIDLMQLSWSSWNGLDPDRSPADKLAGPELARLGAFLKPSWRANDWTWGRMDAAHRLVLLLVDPARLAQLYESSVAALDEIRRTTGVDIAALDVDGEALAELEYLDARDEMPIPTTLPATTKLLSYLVQVDIARTELPLVAAAVRASEERGANAESAKVFAAAVPPASVLADPLQTPDAEVAHLVQLMAIGSESVGAELGYSLMNRTISRGAAVAVNALTGKESGLGLVSSVLRPLRAPLHAVNSLVSVMTSGSRLARGATAFILAVAGALVALRLVGIEVPAGTFAVAAIIFTGAVVVAMLRSGFVRMGAVFAVAAIVVAITAIGSDLSSIVWSTETATEASVVPDGALVDAGSESVLRITRGHDDDERIQDVEVDGATIEVRNGALTVRGAPETDHVTGWKRWGFVNPISIARVVLATVAAFLLALAVRRSRSGRGAVWVALGGIVAAVAALLLPWAAEASLTGRPPEQGSDPKSVLVDVAAALGSFGLEIVLIVMVGIGVAVALGADLLLRRHR